MIIYDYLGEPLTHQKMTLGDTVTSASANCYQYWEHTLLVNGVDAGTVEVAKGAWIVGATSGAVGAILDYSLDAGAWGNANARVTLRLKSVTGTFASTENIKYGANADHFTVRTGETQKRVIGSYPYMGMQAQAITIIVFTNTALVCWDGSTPDQTSLIGETLVASVLPIILRDANAIRNFKAMNYASQSVSVLQITYYF